MDDNGDYQLYRWIEAGSETVTAKGERIEKPVYTYEPCELATITNADTGKPEIALERTKCVSCSAYSLEFSEPVLSCPKCKSGKIS